MSDETKNRINPIHIDKTQVYLDLSSEWLSNHIPSYLKALSIPWKTLHRHDLSAGKLSDHSFIVITDNLDDLLSIQSSLSYKSAKYLELLPKAIISSKITEQTFSIAAQPLKLSSLRYGLRVVAGMESPFDITPDLPENLTLIGSSSQKKKGLILVAEDNQVNQEVIKKQLKTLGYECKLANDGIQAQAIYAQYDFDLVLTDCHMPVCDGYELTTALRQDQIKKGKKIPIIAVTANAMIGEAEKCLAAGMDDYLSKPIEIQKLKRMLEEWTTNNDLLSGTQSMMNHEVIDSIFGGDRNAYKQSITDFKQLSLPQYEALVEVESEDLEMEVIANIAHKLKSSAATIGLNELYQLTQAIEYHSKSDSKPLLMNSLVQLKKLIPKIERLLDGKN
jgi:CheY-like chemotaxis protein/HPt (histidine-containing phosphotransfer) domain-containing protein